MEWAHEFVLDIASATKRVVTAATHYARQKGIRVVQPCHLRLEEEMRAISIACGSVAEMLQKSAVPNGPALDDRLKDWIVSGELQTCFDTLLQMENLLQVESWSQTILKVLRWTSEEDKDRIIEAVNIFDSRKDYFHFLLNTDVLNRERAAQGKLGTQRAQEIAIHKTPDVPQQNELPTPSSCWVVETENGAPAIHMEIDHRENEILSKSIELNLGTENQSGSKEAEREVDRREEEGKKKRKVEEDAMKLDDILTWLNGMDCAEKQDVTLTLRQPDTCNWLYNIPQYQSWRDGKDSFLCLQGKPGAGKSVLASFIIHSLENTLRDGEVLTFFYCDFRNERSTSASEAMRSILSQLLQNFRDGAVDPGSVLDDLLKAKRKGGVSLNNVKKLAGFINDAAQRFGQLPIIVIDALDECKDVEKLLEGLVELKGYVRPLVTTRPLQLIKDGLSSFSCISMDEMVAEVSADIRLHVTRELNARRRLRDLEATFKTEIHSVLCDRADGMFRWIQCSIDTLARCATRKEVREALDNLPEGLEETYERILLAINKETWEGRLAL